jgi:hypothetical protein
VSPIAAPKSINDVFLFEYLSKMSNVLGSFLFLTKSDQYFFQYQRLSKIILNFISLKFTLKYFFATIIKIII